MQEFLTRFRIRHRVSSAYNPHSIQRAEGAVKVAKRMVRDSKGHNGTLNTTSFLAALLLHWNKPDPGTGLPSSNAIFGRRIKDLLPFEPGKMQVRAKWHKLMRHCAFIMTRRNEMRAGS